MKCIALHCMRHKMAGILSRLSRGLVGVSLRRVRPSICVGAAARNYSWRLPPVEGAYMKYINLDQKGKIIATYVWIDGTGENVRSKARTLDSLPQSVDALPLWNFDGSSTGQAIGKNSDIIMKPVAIYRDPFLGGDNILVLTDCYKPDGSPADSNHRNSCKEVMDKVASHDPWFGIEQEYNMLDPLDDYPYGFQKGAFPGPQGPYYCAAGADRIFGRSVCDAHFKACLFAELEITGTNAEVMPGQWEYQIGPSKGISMGDQIWISRYILHRVAEDFAIKITLDPKCMPGDWNGAGAHCNFSTKEMREEGGIKYINEAIDQLAKYHKEHIRWYDPNGGEDNKRRLTGLHETAHIDDFSSGVAHRGASVRITRLVEKAGKGYLEDRRPSSNMDPYRVTEAMVRSIVLKDWNI